MPISPYLRDLRTRVGPARLLLPSVTACIRDAVGRLLLVHERGAGVWSTPGGLVEPDERPADAAVREAWEETGLLVTPERVLAVWGGPEFVVRYPNGDEAQYVMTVFECAPGGGVLRADGEETAAVRFWSAEEAAELPLSPWLRPVLSALYAQPGTALFTPPSWRPPTGAPAA